MKILFTGASSFTGFWFVRALAQAGHEVVCPVRENCEVYRGRRKERVDALRSLCRFVSCAPFGSEPFLELLKGDGWDLLCHHGAEAANYRSPEFDPHQAALNNCRNLASVINCLKSAGAKAILLTGTYFENDEGIGNLPLRAFSPYGLSKGLTWQTFRYFCEHACFPLGKFVIPNPFGPYEEERFTHYLMRSWSARQKAIVKTPEYVRDNIPVDLLSLVYLQVVEVTCQGRGLVLRRNPSGYVESQAAFAERVAREVRPRLNWPCELELMRQEDFSEPLMRLNTEPATKHVPEWNESTAWDQFAQYYHARIQNSPA